jgi:hypothetical protein
MCRHSLSSSCSTHFLVFRCMYLSTNLFETHLKVTAQATVTVKLDVHNGCAVFADIRISNTDLCCSHLFCDMFCWALFGWLFQCGMGRAGAPADSLVDTVLTVLPIDNVWLPLPSCF